MQETCHVAEGAWRKLLIPKSEMARGVHSSSRAGHPSRVALRAQIRRIVGDSGMPMVLITCPRTREPVPTGIVLDTQAFIWASLREQRTHCARCDRNHRWSKEDAYLS